MGFRDTGIGTRLIVIVIVINVLTLALIIGLANSASVNALRDQAVSRFATKNTQVVDTLNSKFQAIVANVRRLSLAISRQDVMETDGLRRLLINYIRLDNDNSLIYRIAIRRPDGSVALMQIPNPARPTEYSWRVYRANESVPRSSDFLRPLSNGQPFWFRQSAAFYDPQRRPSVSLSLPYSQEGVRVGVIWVDIPMNVLRTVILDSLNERGIVSETGEGYALLVDNISVPLTTANLAFQGTNAQQVRNIQLLLGRITSAQPEAHGLRQIIDPFSRKRSYASAGTLTATSWRFVSTFPIDEIPTLPASILTPLILVAAVGALLLMLIINLFVRSAIVVPLQKLGRAAQEIGTGDLRYTIDYRDQRDEIGRLASAMEDMKRSLAHSYNELSAWSRTLEQRVNERTRELHAAQRAAEQAASELRGVYAESLQVVNESKLQPILNAFILRLTNLLKVSYVGLWLLDDERANLRLLATNEPRHSANTIIPMPQGLAGQVVQSGRPIIVDDYPNYEFRARVPNFIDETPFVRGLCAPLMIAGRPIGAVVVGRGTGEDPFDSNDERLLSLFANLVSPAIRNAQLFVQTQAAQDAAERANAVKTRFLASVTHELRTPLNLIINNTEFMRIGAFGEVNSEQLSRLNQTSRSAEHLLELINDLLDISKIEAGEMQVFIQPHNVQTMLEDCIDSAVALMEKIEGKLDAVELIMDVDDDLPSIPMDARRIRQVITNLLSNAIKFTARGTVALIVKRRQDGIYFEVRDSGMGIPEEEMHKLFQAFERTRQAKEADIEGTGLGLPISQFMVRAHGGELHVESQVGQGSRFWFVLPLQRTEDAEDVHTEDIRAMLGEA
ncbi:MAG: ATP-binding protein [Anaerolineae bacterium]|nr:ATP-binding protein [Anaerolineae bacterium]MDW8173948.1 ATP-binding protein [Anaerolineae bacterium]